MPRHARQETELGFSAISVVGGIINPDKLVAIAGTAPDAQTAQSYACPYGTNIRDEIARYFRIGQAAWQIYARIEAPDTKQTIGFVKTILETVFGFEGVDGPHTHHDEGHAFKITLEALGGRVPIVVAPPTAADGVDSFKVAYTEFGDASGVRQKRRPDALLQEWLNASDPALWGLVFAGDRLRLLRDNASFTRPAYIEADLGAIFNDEMFADFTALWLLIHASRFGASGAPVTDCALECWREEGITSGTAARDRLRENVEDALLSLGQGCLEANTALREKLNSGELTDQAWFEQLLRVIYRLIFVAVTEERGLLHDPEAPSQAQSLYADGYSFAQMRERATRRNLRDPYTDVWEGARILFRALNAGEPKLGLPALGGIFDTQLTPDLNDAKIANKHFLNAVYRLSFIQDNQTRVRINWRDMATEELGSVYEGLLELVPTRINQGRDFEFAGGEEARGNARKTSGSYYTPDSLVQALLDSALDPVLDKAEANRGEQGILDLTVIDPACGSAHFLLGAARRMAERVAKLRDNENPDFQHALRDVVRRCIHGVDRNPMAVELAKVALWIEAVEPGKPLGYLDANIRCGDSLLGVFDLAALHHGIPDAAFKPLTGDDNPTAKHYKDKNRREQAEQESIEAGLTLSQQQDLLRDFETFKAMPESTVREVAAKAKKQATLSKDGTLVWKLKKACDFYVAAFLLPKCPDDDHAGADGLPYRGQETIPTSGTIWEWLRGTAPFASLLGNSNMIAGAARAFHWPLEFPGVIAKGGFDVVVGNPPWERIKLQEKEFFAARDPEIASAPNAAARRSLISRLSDAAAGTPERNLWNEFQAAKHLSEAVSTFVRVDQEDGGRFPFTGTGDVNTYALFAELFATLPSPEGRAGVIVPTGIATDATTAPLFAHLVADRRLASLVDFENSAPIFQGVHRSFKFSLLTLGWKEQEAHFAFFLHHPSELAEPERNFTLSPEQIEKINPNTKTAPVFRSQADAELTAKIYSNAPVLIDEGQGAAGNPWGVRFMVMFHMSNDSGLFRTAAQLQATGFVRDGVDWVTKGARPKHAAMAVEGAGGIDLSTCGPRGPQRFVPLYESKMFDLYNHRASDYRTRGNDRGHRVLPELPVGVLSDPSEEGVPYYWVPLKEVEAVLPIRSFLIGYGEATTATTDRTCVVNILPYVGLGHKTILIDAEAPPEVKAALVSNFNSLVFDYVTRTKVSYLTLAQFIFKQLPVKTPEFYNKSRVNFVSSRVLELTYTSFVLKPFATDLGYDGPPFAWDEDQRALLRAELDAFYARAYGLNRNELRYILDPSDVMGEDYPSETFRVLKEKEIRQLGEYRTQRLVLEAWDQFDADGTFKKLGL